MSERKITLDFNTALVALPEATGALVGNDFTVKILPLRGQVMQTDGVCGCHIDRYHMEVKYLDHVTTREQVIADVEAAIAWAAKSGFFPMRGDKTPTATPRPVPVSTTACWWVARVDFSTDLFVDKSLKKTKKIHRKLIADLAIGDGARNPFVSQRSLGVRFDARNTTAESMEAHIQNVIAKILEERPAENYFPHVGPVPEFTYEVYKTPFVI